ncbi:hypothetical protein BN903_9 [Halorubrum sp. AJ67]|nr:hypothetical protein BN903_9 [Halorubrum sp. AJ67]
MSGVRCASRGGNGAVFGLRLAAELTDATAARGVFFPSDSPVVLWGITR